MQTLVWFLEKIIEEVISKICLKSDNNSDRVRKQECSHKAVSNICMGQNNSSS